jgi:phosphatidylglycerophosphate synthase
VAAYRPKFAHELRTEWAIALLYRPVSFVLTPLVAACGASPSSVTLLGLAVACLLPYAALSGGAYAWLSVGALGVAFCVLDCIDGDLARVTGRVSDRGAYLDFIVDVLYRVAMYASVGIVADRWRDAPNAAAGEHIGLATGLLAAVLAIAARACRLYAGANAGSRSGRAAAERENRPAIAFLSGLDHLLPVVVLVLGALGRVEWALAWVFAYSLADFLHTQASVWKRLA